MPKKTRGASAVTDRDVLFGEGSSEQKTNWLLMDLIRLHHVLAHLSGEANVADIVKRLVKLVVKPKPYELAGWKDVPFPFLSKSGGRFFKDGTQLSEKQATEELTKIVTEAFKQDPTGVDADEGPYKQIKAILARAPEVDADGKELPPPIGSPEAKDIILLHTDGPETDKIFDQQSSNKAMFSLATQLVTPYSNDPEKRVEAALQILQGIDEAEIIVEESKDLTKPPVTKPTTKERETRIKRGFHYKALARKYAQDPDFKPSLHECLFMPHQQWGMGSDDDISLRYALAESLIDMMLTSSSGRKTFKKMVVATYQRWPENKGVKPLLSDKDIKKYEPKWHEHIQKSLEVWKSVPHATA